MNDLTPQEVAWLAGIYEGEGSCMITSGRAIRVEIVMTDKDIIDRIQQITALGSVKSLPQRNEKYKQAYRWSVGSLDAVNFLTVILPWLGNRRSQRARDAIDNWNTNKRQSSACDTECVHGHSYIAPNNRRTKYGTCHLCNLEASRKHKAKARSRLP